MKDLLNLVRPWLLPFMLVGVLVGAPSASAQQDDMDDLLGTPAATEPPSAGDNTAVAAAASAPATEGPASTNMLVWTFQALGWMYTIIFLALSITLVFLIVMNLISSRRDNICPADLVEGVEQHLASGKSDLATELIRSDGSFLGQVVSAGLSRLDRGHAAAIEAMQEVGEEETMKLEHNLGYMALIGNISPMIGLFGTVQGMISAFRTIAVSGSTPAAGDLAMDISTALFTTLAGLAVAIPAIAIYNILRNRVQRMTLQVGVTSEGMLQRFIN
ncbi:MAG: MotA/TolQ/ExbB proton channel family protein [Pirellulaceae bacterium]|nr:MotA/TolQ/ExbB proton channel family protein [Pirellulaceae bacterium]